MTWKVIVIGGALWFTSGHSDQSALFATANEASTSARVKGCLGCPQDSDCEPNYIIFHRIPNVAQEPSAYQVYDGPEGCHQGYCPIFHQQCGLDDSELQKTALHAIRNRSAASLAERLFSEGRTVVADYGRETLTVLSCDGKREAFQIRAPVSLLRELVATPGFSTLSVEKGGLQE
jgi:hypothetical protein